MSDTHLTDAAVASKRFIEAPHDLHSSFADFARDFARDLERKLHACIAASQDMALAEAVRKLALCREALDLVLDTSSSMATCYADHAHLMARKNATETITETAP